MSFSTRSPKRANSPDQSCGRSRNWNGEEIRLAPSRPVWGRSKTDSVIEHQFVEFPRARQSTDLQDLNTFMNVPTLDDAELLEHFQVVENISFGSPRSLSSRILPDDDSTCTTLNERAEGESTTSRVTSRSTPPPTQPLIDPNVLTSGYLAHSVIETEPATPRRQRTWTDESDAELRRQVKSQQQAGISPIQWTRIANNLGDRSGVQCQARWAEVLDETIRKGRWSPEEDAMLRACTAQYGSQWSKIAERLRTRTQRQCRSRWLQLMSNGAGQI